MASFAVTFVFKSSKHIMHNFNWWSSFWNLFFMIYPFNFEKHPDQKSGSMTSFHWYLFFVSFCLKSKAVIIVKIRRYGLIINKTPRSLRWLKDVVTCHNTTFSITHTIASRCKTTRTHKICKVGKSGRNQQYKEWQNVI